jgi:hypothetical protein
LKFACLLFTALFFTITVFSQKKNNGFQLYIRKASSSIQLDGALTEQAWKDADAATDFWMVLPMDTAQATVKTAVRMCYDANYLYVIAVCFHKAEQKYMVESLKRDFSFGKNDNFIFFMDTFDDQTNGFSFGSNAAGAQWDGTMYDGGKVDLSWDNKWTSVVKNYTDRWVFEAAIPFKSIRYKKNITSWGINFSRLDINVAEKSSWAPVPRQFPTASLAYSGTLLWDAPPPTAGANISVIPYLLTAFNKNYAAKQPTEYRKNIGADAKIAVSSALNLDITVHPDFSQVEVDRQVTNLDRFELFFPERRQFFLENGDHFSNFGYSSVRPFFSRRIGLNAPMQLGTRLSGKINKDWRIGIMDVQTGKVDSMELPAQNFAVVALQRRVFARSNIGFLFINKQSVSYTPADSAKHLYTAYNRNFGLEYNLASSNNMWTGKAMLLKSFSPGLKGKDWVHAANLLYTRRKWIAGWQHEMVGSNYTAEVGYVPRKDYIKLNPSAARLFFPTKGKILSHGPRLSSSYFFNTGFHQTDNETFLLYSFNFRNQSYFDTWLAHDYVQLLSPFDPTNSGKDTLQRGSLHRWNAWGTDYISKPQKRFTFGFTSRYGGYYANGKRLNITTDIGYRFQPFVNIAVNVSYNNIDLPLPWGRTNFWLIGSRVDVTMTNKLFYTAFVQYNEQQKNVNVNTRFQWRYRPASDLFIVYTDNYYSVPFSVRNRAVVLKFTYWWNM